MKEVQSSYSENYKTPSKEIKEVSKWDYISCPLTERLNIVMRAIPSPPIYLQFNEIPIRISTDMFTETD